jgi:hypothetical protein
LPVDLRLDRHRRQRGNRPQARQRFIQIADADFCGPDRLNLLSCRLFARPFRPEDPPRADSKQRDREKNKYPGPPPAPRGWRLLWLAFLDIELSIRGFGVVLKGRSRVSESAADVASALLMTLRSFMVTQRSTPPATTRVSR